MKPQIAFLGTGIMGAPMCGHLLDAAYPVRAWNRSTDKARALSGRGAEVCATPAEAEMQLKDLRTARELAESLGLDLPVLKLTEDLYRDMCAHGRSQLDHSALYLELADRSRDS